MTEPRTRGNVLGLLDRRLYSMDQVDTLLGLRSGTARRWIDGYERGGKSYSPVIRDQHTGDLVTWGEFVETYLISQYRDRGISLVRLHPLIRRLQEETDSRYPLASGDFMFDSSTKEIVERLQQETKLAKSLYLVVKTRSDQLQWAPCVEEYLERIDWRDGIAEGFFPLGPDSPVVMDPLHSFGMPAVRSVRTEVIAEEFRAGDSLADIAAGYNLEPTLVEAALRYESVRPRAA